MLDIALWVHDGCRAGRFVPNDVGGVSQTGQIKLLKEHGTKYISTILRVNFRGSSQ